MELTERAAYLKGLIEGLGIDETTKEGKIIKAMNELLGELSTAVMGLDEDLTQAYDLINDLNDEIEDLDVYRRTLKGMNPQVQIVFEDAEGEIEEVTEADLPFDVNAEVIEIPPEAYGIWYIDAMDKPDRYRGKTVEFTGMVLKTPDFPKNNFVPGRMAMTCCEADMTFLGFMCKAKNARLLETKDWVKVRARVEYEYMPEYEGEGPMLYADYVEKAEPIEEIVQF